MGGAYETMVEAVKRELAQAGVTTATLDGVRIHCGSTLLSGMPVPSPVSHAKQQADAKIAELLAKVAALEAAAETMGERLEAAEASLGEANARVARLLNPPSDKPHPLGRAVVAWPGRGGVDQWSGMPLSVGRWVK